MTTPTLKQGQQAAADGFFNFLFSKESEIIISGPGGVGKTFLMGYLIDQVLPRYHESCKLLGIDSLYREVHMTATTNKAAEVLGKATKRPTKTIHSFLNLRVEDNYETGVSRLIRTKSWKVHDNLILFVDESSMIDSRLLEMIREGTHQSKIVYVGDHCQLAPVTETLSPIYRKNLPFYELLEPVRNADQPALVNICNQLRDTVETGQFHPIKVVPGVIDLLDSTQMPLEIDAHFTDPTNQDRILAYTNSKVMQYNDYIRELRALPQQLTVGERVISNSAIQFNGSMVHVEDEFEITDAAPTSFPVEIEPGVVFEVVSCTLRGAHRTITGMPVPVDTNHFHALIKYYAKQKDWVKYYRLKNNYPDLRPRDAATVHKAQGSTYDTVFIDMEDLSTCRNPAVAARLLYVAFSRARNRVVMYGKLAQRFGGILT